MVNVVLDQEVIVRLILLSVLSLILIVVISNYVEQNNDDLFEEDNLSVEDMPDLPRIKPSPVLFNVSSTQYAINKKEKN